MSEDVQFIYSILITKFHFTNHICIWVSQHEM